MEISLRSASFFSALSNLQALHSQSAQALVQIGSLKSSLSDLDSTVAQKGLSATRQSIRRKRLKEVDGAIERVRDILRAVDQAEDLCEAGETDTALDIIDSLENEWLASLQDRSDQPDGAPVVTAQPSPALESIGEEDEGNLSITDNHRTSKPRLLVKQPLQHVHLASIAILKPLPGRLITLRQALAKLVQHDLISTLSLDMQNVLKALQSKDDKWPTSHGSLPESVQSSIQNDLPLHATIPITRLVRCGQAAVEDALSAWRDELLKEVRQAIRQVGDTLLRKSRG